MNNEIDIHTEEKSFLLEKVLKNLTGEFLKEDLEQISLLKRDKVITTGDIHRNRFMRTGCWCFTNPGSDPEILVG